MYAFPNVHDPKTGSMSHGMTLRDYFAGQALVGILPDAFQKCPDDYTLEPLAKLWAEMAYEIADQMIRARNL